MKKLLTILTLALALCLLCSSAMATATYKAQYEFDSYYDLHLGQTIEDVYGKEWNIIEIPANVKKAAHTDGAQVNVSAKNILTGEVAILEIKVKSTHQIVWDDVKSYDPTCSKTGVFALKCKDCSWTYTEELDKIDHVVKNVTVAPTCQAAGRLQVVCIVCNKVISDKVDPANPVPVDHAYEAYDGSDPKDLKAPYNSLAFWSVTAPKCNDTTEVQDGTAKPKCKFGCGKVNSSASFTWTKDQIHGEGTGFYSGFMEKFDQHIPASYDGHDWDTPKAVAANCFHGKGEEKWCKNCSKYVLNASTAETAKAAAKWVVAPYDPILCSMSDGDEVEVYCSICKGNPEGHGSFKATLTKGTAKTAKDATKTDYETYIPYTAKFTDKAGNNVEFVTNVYHQYYHPTGNHKEWDTVADADRTPESNGCEIAWLGEYECVECGQTMYKVDGEPSGHKWSQWKLYDDGEGKTDTKRYERICSVCEKREIKAFGTTPPVIHNTEKEHVYRVDPDNKYTCNEENEVKYICDCGATKTVTEKKEHVSLVETVVTAATCQEKGLKHRVCKNCGLDEYVEIPVGDHTPDTPIVTAATTEKEGSEVIKCKVCGETISTKVLPKLLAPTEFTSTYKFDTENMTLAGTATQKEGTKPTDKVFARVTYFLADGTFIAVSVPVEEDGTFESMCTSPLAHVSVRIVDSAKVRPGEYNYLDK